MEFDLGRVVYAAFLLSGVNSSDSLRDKSKSFKEDRPFLGIMYVIWPSYLSWADVSSFQSAQDPDSTAFVVYSLSTHWVIVRLPVPGPGARSE